ncbi:MAG: His/Gly/Thr/Pro-type tRNA ligase C-terminal domain-containing protein [Candidatus Pacebacteria bacterium]|nr:His/Gly/Thr/Pro-type tRNA ligase C-terminal domain-containing protein [Candidatus Paceibacterota bacterium]
MKQTDLFAKTFKETPRDEVSLNAQMLIRGGFVDKLGAGIYTFLPLGLRVIAKIEKIVREEMDNIQGQEVLMPLLLPKDSWEETGRWNVPEMYKIKDENLGLGWTHEEIITPLMKKHILSSKDLPKHVYQINTKFRNEPRAKSGLLRGREFKMKDLYSFHANEEDLNEYYERVKQAYFRVYERCGLKEKTYLARATGGEFSDSLSHEFQTITPAGEDIIYICKKCGTAFNKEVFEKRCDCGSEEFIEEKSIEVGNIFKLGSRYTKVFGLKNEDGSNLIMGCYGIGISRLMGAIVEVFNDDKGIIWPASVAPFSVHLVSLDGGDSEIKARADEIYSILQNSGIEVLYDNRDDKTAGEKLNDCDLIGIPLRVVVSSKTLKEESVELKKRKEEKARLVKIKEIKNEIQP